MEQGSDSKAAGNRALKEWGASFERCDEGQGGGSWWGGGWLGGQGDAECARAAGGRAQVQPQTQATFAATERRGDRGCGIGGGVRGWGEGGGLRSSEQAFNGGKGLHQAVSLLSSQM